jgi:hypothetical protein
MEEGENCGNEQSVRFISDATDPSTSASSTVYSIVAIFATKTEQNCSQDGSIIQALNHLHDQSNSMKAELGKSIGLLKGELSELLQQVIFELKMARHDDPAPSAQQNPSLCSPDDRRQSNQSQINSKFLIQNRTNSDLSTHVEQISSLEYRGKLMTRRLSFLQSLHFPGMNIRHFQIADAHPNTCLWAYNSIFIEWLRSSESLFWVRCSYLSM